MLAGERVREVSTFCGWSEPRRRPTGQFSKDWKIRESCLVILWPSWQFYSGGVWKSHRKEVQKTEHNPKKTQQNAISGDNKGGKGDGVGRRGDSMEILSVPDSELTVLWREKGEEKKGGRDKWGGGGEPWSLQGGKARPFSGGKTRNRENVEWKEKEGSNLADSTKERESWRRKRSNYRWGGQENKLEWAERRNVHRSEGWRLWWGWMEWRDKSERNTYMMTLHPLSVQRWREERREQAEEDREKARGNLSHF